MQIVFFMNDYILSCMIFLIIIHDFHIFLVGNISATHRLEMRGFQLTIYHLTSMLLQITSQEDEGYL